MFPRALGRAGAKLKHVGDEGIAAAVALRGLSTRQFALKRAAQKSHARLEGFGEAAGLAGLLKPTVGERNWSRPPYDAGADRRPASTDHCPG